MTTLFWFILYTHCCGAKRNITVKLIKVIYKGIWTENEYRLFDRIYKLPINIYVFVFYCVSVGYLFFEKNKLVSRYYYRFYSIDLYDNTQVKINTNILGSHNFILCMYNYKFNNKKYGNIKTNTNFMCFANLIY